MLSRLKSRIPRRHAHKTPDVVLTSSERPPSPRRKPVRRGFKVIKDPVLVEEEGLQWYNSDDYYPVQVGDVFVGRYQTIGKLGFGSASTVWLCRDLKYVAIKLYASKHRQAANEHKVLEHLQVVVSESNHPGRKFVRIALDTFELDGVRGPHRCIVYEPLGATLRIIQGHSENSKIPSALLKPMIKSVLSALDFLHTEAHIVHTDIYANNIMMTIANEAILKRFEQEERTYPSPRKVNGKHVLYQSRRLITPVQEGLPILCDLGDARFGADTYIGEVMPDLYRAPEIIMGTDWNEKIDIWALALMIWDMFEGKRIFSTALPNRTSSRSIHLGRMISVLGPPPLDLVKRSRCRDEFWDEDDTYKLDNITTTTLESEEENLHGEEKALFLGFIRRMLQWRPEDRASAAELISDPWLQLP